MDAQEIEQPQNHQVVMNRFVAACQTDERVVAAFLGGSYARDAADAYSDLDLYLITTDEAYDDFYAKREAFIRRLGEPVFQEDYHGGGADFVFFTFPDGIEVERGLGRESHFTHIHGGPYRVLLDKKGILAGAVFPWYDAAPAEQTETLHRLVSWFWHDLSHHFITTMARGQLWSAYGALEDMRLTCVNLARLRENFQAEAEGYEKVEQALPVEQLAPLQATFCPLERDAMLQAALVLVSFTYTAIFHIPAHTAGGTIQFAYTLNNGRSQTTGTVTAGAGETSKTFTFDSSGALSPDHTYPGTAMVMVTSPNHVISPSVKPSGACVEPGPFQVTAVSMTVNPTSIAGKSCGTFLTVTSTAMFHLAPNGPGGTIQFEYTVNNGRGTNMASITVAPGQTTASYSFLWSGNLPVDHTYPGAGGVIVHSPNEIRSSLLGPSGRCS